MSQTTRTTASVKVMLSYDYCHFEISISLANDDGIWMKEINQARKDCQRLADNAVLQYKKHKEAAAKRDNATYDIRFFENECKKIESMPEADRTLKQIAMLKQYKDENWQSKFDYNYDYEDDNDKW